MILKYDDTADALYITLREGVGIARTEELEPGTLVDVDRYGELVGIELIHPARAWAMNEVIGVYAIADEDVDVLRSLWAEGRAYPFEKRELVVA